MKDKQMEELIDACCNAMFQRDEEVEKWLDEQYDRLDQLEYEKQEIGLIMHGQSDYYYQNPDEYEKDRLIVELENEVERLEHRLSNCIEPKFKIGQEVYMIDSTKVEITGYKIINFDNPETLYRIKDDEITFGNIPENELFATEEEAKAKLEEMEK